MIKELQENVKDKVRLSSLLKKYNIKDRKLVEEFSKEEHPLKDQLLFYFNMATSHPELIKQEFLKKLLPKVMDNSKFSVKSVTIAEGVDQEFLQCSQLEQLEGTGWERAIVHRLRVFAAFAQKAGHRDRERGHHEPHSQAVEEVHQALAWD